MKTAEYTIQIRIDTKTKEASRKILEEMGLDMSSAIKMFLKNVAITHSIPFEVRTANGFTVAQEQEILQDLKEAKENGQTYTTVEDFMKDLKS